MGHFLISNGARPQMLTEERRVYYMTERCIGQNQTKERACDICEQWRGNITTSSPLLRKNRCNSAPPVNIWGIDDCHVCWMTVMPVALMNIISVDVFVYDVFLFYKKSQNLNKQFWGMWRMSEATRLSKRIKVLKEDGRDHARHSGVIDFMAMHTPTDNSKNILGDPAPGEATFSVGMVRNSVQLF